MDELTRISEKFQRQARNTATNCELRMQLHEEQLRATRMARYAFMTGVFGTSLIWYLAWLFCK